MIFVTLGTQDKPFVRLLKKLEELNTDEEIIVQAGFTKYTSSRLKIYEYLDKNKFDEYMKKADLIIAHAGVGTIMQALANDKKVIVCPRLAKYGEHQNDHQLQIADTFYQNGYILRLLQDDDINEIYLKSKDFIPNKYISNNQKYLDLLSEFMQL